MRTAHPALVAVPAYHLAPGRVKGWSAGGYGVPDRYVDALARAGVAAAILPAPATANAPAEDVLAGFAGLLLVGGGDLEPARYGAEPHPEVYGVDVERDALELGFAAAALDLGLPMLAVCRGLQVVNLARGGTLHQHLPDRTGMDVHGDAADGVSLMHPVTFAPGSRLDAAVGGVRLDRCTSHHHQGVDRVGSGLVPVAWSDDGLVEALEPAPTSSGDDDPWMLAVQWHPEVTAADDPAQQAIFDAFADHVRKRATLVPGWASR